MATAGWFEKSFHRLETTLHVGEARPEFLSKFDARQYVELVKLAHADATHFFASSHGGHSFWPTRVGYQHPLLRGRDLLGEVLDACRAEAIPVVLYYSVIFSGRVGQEHPDWRIVGASGEPVVPWRGRADGVCCPNSPYRDFVAAQLEELCAGYDFDGLWADMTFWPAVCYCRHCEQRHREEVGEELPRDVNWQDPVWVRFQRKREEWLADFAALVTGTVKRLKPAASVAHQGSAFCHSWERMAPSLELARQSDYVNHDFYGGPLEQSFFCKLFASLGRSPHFEYVTDSYHRREVTTVKTQALLEAHTFLAVAHGGAMRIYDDPNPDGTFERATYERLGRVYGSVEPLEPYLGGEPCADVAIYVNFESGVPVGGDDGVRDSGIGAEVYPKGWQYPPQNAQCLAGTLIGAHIPFAVITRKNLARLADYQLVILPNISAMDDEEIESLTEFVAAGGSLYASKYTSLLNKNGQMREDFALADVFGVSFRGETHQAVTFVAPVVQTAEGAGRDLFRVHSPRHPMTIPDRQLNVTTHADAEVLATITLPYTDPRDPAGYAQIHSNPPGVPTTDAALVLNTFGKGRSVYAAGVLEGLPHDVQREMMVRLLKELPSRPLWFEADTPPSVEVLMYHQPERRRYVVHLVNFVGLVNARLPNVPVDGAVLRVRPAHGRPERLVLLPQEKVLDFTVADGYLRAALPRIETHCMLVLEYS